MSVLSQLCVDTRILRCMFWPMSRGLQKQRARWREHPGRDLGGLTTAEQRGGSQGIAGEPLALGTLRQRRAEGQHRLPTNPTSPQLPGDPLLPPPRAATGTGIFHPQHNSATREIVRKWQVWATEVFK